MSKAKDLTGTRVGKLLLVERKRENNRTYYLCKCDCGNEKWIRADGLTKKNKTSSCGCLAEKTKFKAKDLSGKRFGRLVALEPTEERDKSSETVIWRCKCDCGNTKNISSYLLTSGRVRSCGCLQKEWAKKQGNNIGDMFVKNYIKNETNIKAISRIKPMSHNTSGYSGVKWDKEREKWIAEIRFKNKIYYLGRYKDKQEAIKVRKEAEGKLHKEFLKNYKRK